MDYMANKISEQIENSEKIHEEALEDLRIEIQDYIERMEYTWDAREIMGEYAQKYKKGYYTSFTCREIIERFKTKLEHVL